MHTLHVIGPIMQIIMQRIDQSEVAFFSKRSAEVKKLKGMSVTLDHFHIHVKAGFGLPDKDLNFSKIQNSLKFLDSNF